MPAPVIKSISKKSSKSTKELEKLWDKAVDMAKKKDFPDDVVMYKYATGILKKMAGVSEVKLCDKLVASLNLIN